MTRTLGLPFNLSLGVHVAFFGLYLFFIQNAPKLPTASVSDVDILVPIRQKIRMAAKSRAGTKPTTWNFLKMALPQTRHSQSAPKITSTMERKVQMPEPLLKEQTGSLKSNARLTPIAISEKSRALAEAAAKSISARQARVPLEASLKLEEIGSKRAPNLPPDITLENTGLPAYSPRNLKDIKNFVAAQRSRPVGTPEPLAADAGRSGASSGRVRQERASGFNSVPSLQLEGQSGFGSATLARPKMEAIVKDTVAARPKRETLKSIDQNKPAQIVGPLSQRTIIKFYIPSFPDWAREQRVLEAFVSIRFYVSRDGRVMDDMVVERSSGFGALDRSAMDTLRKWIFAPSSSELEREWGVITFKYIME